MSTLPPFSPPPKLANINMLSVNSPQFQSCLSLLELCNATAELTQAHSKFVKLGLFHHPLALTRLLACCSLSPDADMNYARSIFEHDKNPNTFAYNVMIRGYLQQNLPEDSLCMFYRMVSDCNYGPNYITFPFVLKACSKLKSLEEGRQVHGQVLKFGFGEDVYVQNSLISFYCSCGVIEAASTVLEKMRDPDIVSWNSIITGLVNLGLVEEARQIVDKMPKRSIVTWNCLIDGYVKLKLLDHARKLFDEMAVKDSFSWNIVIGGYVDAGLTESAQNLFHRMPEKVKDLITFRLMIDLYARDGRDRETLDTFNEMQKLEVKPDNFILANALSACSNLVLLEQGEQIHAYIEREGIEVDAVLGTSLIDMFSKCGLIQTALSVFSRIDKRDTVAWNAIIYNLGITGYGEEALALFADMLEAEVTPDETTFLGLLSTCRHCGLIDDGKRILNLMSDVYNLAPKAEHYGCIIDLLARADLLDEARELIDGSEVKFNIPVWGALLGAACRLGNIELGEYAAEHIMELDPNDTSCYVELSNMYSAAGMYDRAAKIRKQMRTKGMEKEPGCSSIEINGVTYNFRVSSTFPDEIDI